LENNQNNSVEVGSLVEDTGELHILLLLGNSEAAEIAGIVLHVCHMSAGVGFRQMIAAVGVKRCHTRVCRMIELLGRYTGAVEQRFRRTVAQVNYMTDLVVALVNMTGLEVLAGMIGLEADLVNRVGLESRSVDLAIEGYKSFVVCRLVGKMPVVRSQYTLRCCCREMSTRSYSPATSKSV